MMAFLLVSQVFWALYLSCSFDRQCARHNGHLHHDGNVGHLHRACWRFANYHHGARCRWRAGDGRGERAGQGATVTTVVNVTPGDTVRFVIGAAGATGDLESGGGGGTGVFVNGVLAMVAGGGGGEDNTGNGSGGQAGTSGSSGGPFAGTAGSGGNGGGGGGDVSLGDGGGGGGGILSAGGNVNAFGPSLTTGGGQADTVLGDGLSVSAGGTSNQTTDPAGADGIGTSGGSGFGGGGAGVAPGVGCGRRLFGRRRRRQRRSSGRRRFVPQYGHRRICVGFDNGGN